MKTLLAITSLLFFVGVAQAEFSAENNDGIKRNHVNQQLSKRPYVAPVENTSEKFEGSVVTEEVELKKHKPLNLHQLGRRAYSAE
jgi:hypothetical protein